MFGVNQDIDMEVQTGRASIPCNPNTIFDVGNMVNPVYVLRNKSKQF
jgi:hypothetical protein